LVLRLGPALNIVSICSISYIIVSVRTTVEAPDEQQYEHRCTRYLGRKGARHHLGVAHMLTAASRERGPAPQQADDKVSWGKRVARNVSEFT